jgi:hypothetical protein
VQISLSNTLTGTLYPSAIVDGAAAEASVTMLEPLYDVDGATGEFTVSKFYVIKDKDFFSSLNDYDAHVSIMQGDDIVAIGDVGANAEPIEEGD